MARSKDPAVERARRELIADVTMRLLAEGSWRRVTLSRVAECAGVSKGVVTYWFANKDALLVAAVERFHERYTERFASIVAQDLPIRERFALLLAAALPDRESLLEELQFQAEVISYAKENPAIEELIQASYAQFRLACEALIALGVEEGYVTTSRREGLYLFIHGMIDGMSVQLAYTDGLDVVSVRERLLLLLERWLQD